MTKYRVLPVLTGLLAAVLLAGVAAGAGEKYVTYGADTTPAERQELARIFGVDAAAQAAVVTTPEMVQALQGTGLPAAPTDKSISSSVLTCLNRGDGLTVRTQNITRIPAPVYANALVTAGVGDGDVLIAAPTGNPVTGETALVGVLKAFPQCQAGRQPEAARVQLAYEQIARTVALAGPNGDLTAASNVLLRAGQPVILGQATDDAAIGRSLDQAAATGGVAVPAEQRPALVAFLKRLGGLDYGAYARGYQVEQLGANQVRVVPAGAGAPAQGGQAGGAANQAGQPAGTGFTGEVTATGDALTVKTGDQERRVTAAPGVTVTRNGDPAQISDIRRGDGVRVTTNPDGSTQRIDAESGGGSNMWLWLAPLLLLLPLLFFLFRQRRRTGVVVQRTAPVQRIAAEETVIEPARTDGVRVHERRIVSEQGARRYETTADMVDVEDGAHNPNAPRADVYRPDRSRG